MMERDNTKEVIEIPEQLNDRMSKQYQCPTCKALLPKAVYSRARKPLYCLWCGQKLKYQMDCKEELIDLTLNDTQKKLLERVDNILEGREY